MARKENKGANGQGADAATAVAGANETGESIRDRLASKLNKIRSETATNDHLASNNDLASVASDVVALAGIVAKLQAQLEELKAKD